VHGALVAASAPLASSIPDQVRSSLGAEVGYLASVRNVTLHVDRLDDLEDDLVACAERLAGDARTVLYQFQVTCGGRPILEGRASVVIDPALNPGSASA
jgi:predicted hotdog family 3-hydroxylacyl-ACP dehydratase